MKKKFVISIMAMLLIVLCIFPGAALGAGTSDITFTHSGPADMSIGVGSDVSATITGQTSYLVTSFELFGGENLDLTMTDANIDNSGSSAYPCPLSFTGTGNILRVAGTCVLKGYSGSPAIRVASGADLTITGTGTLTVYGGGNSAGIGSGAGVDCGTITISPGVTVIAYGGTSGAGIGGGNGGNGGDIRISGGTVTGIGGGNGAGIGGGSGGNAGTISISGGTVTGRGYSDGFAASGAGIGGGIDCSGGSVDISGGTVTAVSDNVGAGIGGGNGGGGVSVSISGGVVYASGNGGSHDIGKGDFGSAGTLSISGNAAVFLSRNSCVTPDTDTHTPIIYTTDTEESYGYSIPSEWTPTFGSYLRIYTLFYDAGSGSGTLPDSITQLYNTTATVANGSGLSRTNYAFNGWNTMADGSGTGYAAGGAYTLTDNATLFAQWKAVPTLGSSDGDGIIYTGGRVTLTPNIEGGEWDWDDAFFTATFNSPATFTALKAGTSTITYTVEGESVSYPVTIREAELPSTGQDFTWVYIAAGGAALLVCAAGVLARKRISARAK